MQDIFVISQNDLNKIEKNDKETQHKRKKRYQNVSIEVNKLRYGYSDENEIYYKFEVFYKNDKKAKVFPIDRTYR